MLKNFTILIFVLIAAAINANAQKTDKAADETAIRANVAQMMKGWNAGNGAEFAKPFAEDADYGALLERVYGKGVTSPTGFEPVFWP